MPTLHLIRPSRRRDGEAVPLGEGDGVILVECKPGGEVGLQMIQPSVRSRLTYKELVELIFEHDRVICWS